eukprot:TRINITY_DN187_c0_g3_i1.p1 TRINITY_DN187_c0_g3~~TRINITY_DN187_c0_g3_i1.p1  ORF type:complete len:380 (+),score=89.86 TRINITY_DN187_c0_g3_i1:51-1190(+)
MDYDMEIEELDLATPAVVDKYKAAAEVVNKAMEGVISQCVAGAKVSDVCKFGDAVIEQLCAATFKKNKEMEKGLAYPTTVSINECVAHYSPLESESCLLKDGDWLKIKLGAHFDGYVAESAHTMIIMTEAAPITGRAADVLMAAYTAQEVAHRLCKAGRKSTELTDAFEKIGKSFGVTPMYGTTSHKLKRFIVESNDCIGMTSETPDIEEHIIEPNSVYAIEIMYSTGESKPRERGDRATVHKRNVEVNFSLRVAASRQLCGEVQKKYPTMPFSLRAIENERTAKLGIAECVKSEVFSQYPVVYEKDGDMISHLTFTVLLLPSQQLKVTGMELPLEIIHSEKELDNEIKTILATMGTKKSKKKKNKKKAKKSVEEPMDM